MSRSDQAPRKEKGRRKGRVCIMKVLWDDNAYVNLQLTSQNLRDRMKHQPNVIG